MGGLAERRLRERSGCSLPTDARRLGGWAERKLGRGAERVAPSPRWGGSDCSRSTEVLLGRRRRGAELRDPPLHTEVLRRPFRVNPWRRCILRRGGRRAPRLISRGALRGGRRAPRGTSRGRSALARGRGGLPPPLPRAPLLFPVFAPPIPPGFCTSAAVVSLWRGARLARRRPPLHDAPARTATPAVECRVLSVECLSVECWVLSV